MTSKHLRRKANSPSSKGPREAIGLLMILVGVPTDLLGDAKYGLRDFEGELCDVLVPEPKRSSECKYNCMQINAYQVATPTA